MFSKIVVPLDGTAFGEQALPYAIRLANSLNCHVQLLRATEVRKIVGQELAIETVIIQTAKNYLTRVLNIITDPTLSCHIDPLRVETLVEYGRAEDQIGLAAPFEGADLVVMTTHSRTGFSRLVKGSIAWRVLQLATVPVVLIHPQSSQLERPLRENLTGPYSLNPAGAQAKLLVTLDGSPSAEISLEIALQLAKQIPATLYLTQVVTPLLPVDYIEPGQHFNGYIGSSTNTENQKRREEAFQYLDKLQARLLDRGINCCKQVLVGDPASEIRDYAERMHIGMLVMATHARGSIGQMVLGSVAEQVVRYSHLPVIMVHTALPIKDYLQERAADLTLLKS